MSLDQITPGTYRRRDGGEPEAEYPPCVWLPPDGTNCCCHHVTEGLYLACEREGRGPHRKYIPAPTPERVNALANTFVEYGCRNQFLDAIESLFSPLEDTQ